MGPRAEDIFKLARTVHISPLTTISRTQVGTDRQVSKCVCNQGGRKGLTNRVAEVPVVRLDLARRILGTLATIRTDHDQKNRGQKFQTWYAVRRLVMRGRNT
jgi:hypothetical protein